MLVHEFDGRGLVAALGLERRDLRLPAGLVRQRPGTAKGFVFLSLEDEKGISNIVITPKMFERYRLIITQEAFLLVEGILQIRSDVVHVRARKFERLPTFALETASSHDFR